MEQTEIITAIACVKKHHLAELRLSGLTDETIARAGIYTEDSHSNILIDLNMKSIKKGVGSALMFPFRDHKGEMNGYRRLKFDQPRKDRNGKSIKYESPRGLPNRVYIPHGTFGILSEPKIELLITEGEKKSLCADQHGFPCLGLVGVHGWKVKNSETLLPDLERVEWNGRRVIICFGSDLNDKPEIKDAESRLAAQLKLRGASVKVARLPDGPDGEKVGVDDFLVDNDCVAFRKILEAAGDPEPVDSGTLKIHANQLDPVIEARRFLTKLTTDNDEKKLRYWKGSFWLYEENKFRELSEDELKSALYKFEDPFASHLSRAVIGNIQSAAEALAQLQSSIDMPAWLNQKGKQRNCVALQNGILDIDAVLSGDADCLLPHSPQWFSPVCLPYAYDMDCDFPKWNQFLNQNLEDDQNRIDLLQEWFGYCLVPFIRLQKFMLLEGEGANGKSVISAVLRGVLGSENVSHVPLELFGKTFSLFPTLGKLANICSEVGEMDKIAEANLKAFTSGDSMQFERKHKDPIQAVPTAKLTLSTNNRPRFSDRSGGLWRRMILFPLDVTISESERVLGMDSVDWWQEAGELPGILNWSLVGLMRLLHQQRFTQPEVCEEALDEYRVESNPAREFLTANFHEDPLASVETELVYKRYGDFCEANGYRQLGERTFGKEVRRVFKKVDRRRIGSRGNRFHVYEGLSEGENSCDTCDT